MDLVDRASDEVGHHARALIEIHHGHDVGDKCVEGWSAALLHDGVGVDGTPSIGHLPAGLAPAAPAEWPGVELGLLALLAPLDDQFPTGGGVPERLGGAVGCRQDPTL